MSKNPAFVIQEHDASNRHYDFRLEAGGALKSWAVPRGLSTDPRDKRLAIRTEDHSLDYADFEGVIPDNEYGAGAVIVWDRGAYENLTEKDGKPIAIEDAIEQGHAKVRRDGEKLRGGYALQRISDGSKEQWLIIKIDDGEADARRNPVSTQRDSVLSGKTVEEISRERDTESS